MLSNAGIIFFGCPASAEAFLSRLAESGPASLRLVRRAVSAWAVGCVGHCFSPVATRTTARHGDIGMRRAGDLVLGQGHQLGAAWQRQRAPRGRGEVMMRPPGGDEHAG